MLSELSELNTFPKFFNAKLRQVDIWVGVSSYFFAKLSKLSRSFNDSNTYKNFINSNVDIRQIKDNRISFVISDTTGYYLFFESRYLIPANKKTFNAVIIDPISIKRLKHHFFQAYKNKSEYENEIANSVIDETVLLKNIAFEFNQPPQISQTKFNQEMFEQVEVNLATNPPLKPDYRRVVEFYSNKFQYARLEVFGANLFSKKIELPKDALPIKDADLKKQLETKLNLFDQEFKPSFFNTLNNFNEYAYYIRCNFLTPLKCRKESLLDKSDKNEFLKAVNILREKLLEVTSNKMLEISRYIESTKQRLVNDLSDFFFQNKELVFPNISTQPLDDEYVKLEAVNLAKHTVFEIKWPKAIDLINGFKINTYFSDITYEDLKNPELINELIEKGKISSKDLKNLTDIGLGITLKN